LGHKSAARGTPEKLLAITDTITVMESLKHAFDSEIPAKKASNTERYIIML
jgi:ATP:corrinoid adenosyltransferase